MGGTIGVKFGKNRRKQSAAASTTSDKFLFIKGQRSELIGVKFQYKVFNVLTDNVHIV